MEKLKVILIFTSYRVQHLKHFVLFTGVQAIDDDSQACLVLGEAVDGLGHLSHQLHLILQHLEERRGHMLTQVESTGNIKMKYFFVKPLNSIYLL